MKLIFYSILFLLIITACQKKINGSSESEFKESVQAISKSMSKEKAEEFEKATMLIYANQVDFAKIFSDAMSGKLDTNTTSVQTVIKALDGKTGDQVIELGNKIQDAIKSKEKQQAKMEIEELYQKSDKSLKDLIELSKFQVITSRFYKREGYLGTEPIIALKVKNGTSSSISRVFFKATLISPTRSVPWLKEDFNYSIRGGIEPGEEQTWSLAPNTFEGNWNVDAPKDAIFTVKVVEVYGADEKSLYSANFSEEDKSRIEGLLKSYPEFKR